MNSRRSSPSSTGRSWAICTPRIYTQSVRYFEITTASERTHQMTSTRYLDITRILRSYPAPLPRRPRRAELVCIASIRYDPSYRDSFGYIWQILPSFQASRPLCEDDRFVDTGHLEFDYGVPSFVGRIVYPSFNINLEYGGMPCAEEGVLEITGQHFFPV